MVGTRHFSGTRSASGSRVGAASEMMRLEIQKKGKLPAAMRYKRIMQKKMEENKQKALGSLYKKPFSLNDKIGGKKMSARAEQALKEIAMKKARKLAKEERKMVIVQPRNYHNGYITKKGEIFDVAGNMVARVNTKNGSIASMSGWGIGKYKPKSMFTDMMISESINKYSPYFINQRKLQMMQQQGIEAFGVHGAMMNQDVINVHGAMSPAQMAMNPYGYVPGQDDPNGAFGGYGSADVGPRQAIGVTAWGARSDNVWGTYTDNAWGVSSDNVWGGNSTDVWGGIGAGNLWGGLGGRGGIRIWGTGNGKNYLSKLTGFIGALFGFSSKKNREALRQMTALARAQRNSGGGGSSGAGSTARAPTTTRTR